MQSLYEDPFFTFRFADDRLVERFHLEGVPLGHRVSVFRVDACGDREERLASAVVGVAGWVDLPAPIVVRAGGGFIAVAESPNLFGGIPNELPKELVETLLAAGPVRIERIVSTGQASPEGFWYDQDNDEWILLLSGAARLRFENDDNLVPLTPGTYLNIPAYARHRVEWTDPSQPTVWLAIHYRK